MTHMIVSPELHRPERHCASWTVAAPSSPEVGSSMKIIAGMAASSIPTAPAVDARPAAGEELRRAHVGGARLGRRYA